MWSSKNGQKVRNRSAGMGLPLIAVNSKAKVLSGERVIPLTAFLRIEGDRSEIARGTARAELELYDSFDNTELIVNGRMVPMETDSTAPIAYALDNPDIWSAGQRRFLLIEEEIQPYLMILQPYAKGRIPLVLVQLISGPAAGRGDRKPIKRKRLLPDCQPARNRRGETTEYIGWP
jgi:hypothetical protein